MPKKNILPADYGVHVAVLELLDEQEIMELPWDLRTLVAAEFMTSGASFVTVEIDSAKLSALIEKCKKIQAADNAQLEFLNSAQLH